MSLTWFYHVSQQVSTHVHGQGIVPIEAGSMRWLSQRLLKNLNRSSIRLFVSYKHLFALEHSTRILTAHPQHLHLRDLMDSLPASHARPQHL